MQVLDALQFECILRVLTIYSRIWASKDGNKWQLGRKKNVVEILQSCLEVLGYQEFLDCKEIISFWKKHWLSTKQIIDVVDFRTTHNCLASLQSFAWMTNDSATCIHTSSVASNRLYWHVNFVPYWLSLFQHSIVEFGGWLMTTQPAYTQGVGPSPILEQNCCTYNTNTNTHRVLAPPLFSNTTAHIIQIMKYNYKYTEGVRPSAIPPIQQENLLGLNQC